MQNLKNICVKIVNINLLLLYVSFYLISKVEFLYYNMNINFINYDQLNIKDIDTFYS